MKITIDINADEFRYLTSHATLSESIYNFINSNEQAEVSSMSSTMDNRLEYACTQAVKSIYGFTYQTTNKIPAIILVRAIVQSCFGTDHPLFSLVEAKKFVENLK